MLHRYEGKTVRITTEDGCVFTGEAEACPSGYGLCEFDRAEESIRIDDVQIFQSDIRKIEVLKESADPEPARDRYDDLMGRLLEGPYRIVDVLPEQVPEDAGGQYFAVERYYLQPERLGKLRRSYAEILLRLNCYEDMEVSFDSCASWEKNPDPEAFAEKLVKMSGNDFLRAVFPAEEAMIDLEPYDTYMTVYDGKAEFLDRIRKLAEAEGFFMWAPPENE